MLVTGQQNRAAILLRASSVQNMDFTGVRMERSGYAGLVIDSANGVESKNNRIDVQYNCGAGASGNNEQISHGVVLAGGNIVTGAEDLLVSQNDVSASGETYDGNLVHVAGAVANRIHKAWGTIQAGGSGRSLYFANASVSGANNNAVGHLRGKVQIESDTWGNSLENWNADEAGLTAPSGSHIDFTVRDFVDGRAYQTHRYAMTDKLNFPTGYFMPTSSPAPTQGIFDSLVGGWLLDSASTTSVGTFLPAPYAWGGGFAYIVRIFYGALAAGDWVLNVKLSTMPSGQVITPDLDETVTVTIPGAFAGRVIAFDVGPTTPTVSVAYEHNENMCLSVARVGGDVSDTSADDIVFLGAQLVYQSLGPTSAGIPGPFNPTLPYKL
jgi:hypothetical protein